MEVACYSEEMVGHFQRVLDNPRVNDLTMLHNSRPILTVVGISLLLEGLSELSVKYKCYAGIFGI